MLCLCDAPKSDDSTPSHSRGLTGERMLLPPGRSYIYRSRPAAISMWLLRQIRGLCNLLCIVSGLGKQNRVLTYIDSALWRHKNGKKLQFSCCFFMFKPQGPMLYTSPESWEPWRYMWDAAQHSRSCFTRHKSVINIVFWFGADSNVKGWECKKV